jgi:hypothetical protein
MVVLLLYQLETIYSKNFEVTQTTQISTALDQTTPTIKRSAEKTIQIIPSHLNLIFGRRYWLIFDAKFSVVLHSQLDLLLDEDCQESNP